MSQVFANKPMLTGDLVVLRPFRGDDLGAMSEILADPDVLRLTGSVNSTAQAHAGRTETDEALREWYLSRNEQTDRLDLAVTVRDGGDVVGEVVLNEYDPASASCNFRTLIGSTGRDRGLGTEAARLVVGYALGHLGLHRIELEVYAFNPRARRAYEKVGFVYEGTRRDALRFDGAWVDATMMSILSTEWDGATR